MIRFYVEEFLAPRPTPKLEDLPLSTVHDFLFDLFAATHHIGGRSSIRILRTRHAVVTGTHLSRHIPFLLLYLFVTCTGTLFGWERRKSERENMLNGYDVLC